MKSDNTKSSSRSSEGRGRQQRCSVKEGVLRILTKFPGKQLWQSLFFNKVAGLRPATLLKKRPWHSCFSVNFVKFLRTPFLQNTSGRLLGDTLRRSLKIVLSNCRGQKQSARGVL